MKISQKGFTAVEGLLIVLVLAVVSFGGYYVWNHQKDKKPATTTSTTTTQAKSNTVAETPKKSVYDGWKEYCSTEEKSCFKYPADWTYTTDKSDFSNRSTFKSPAGSTVVWTAAISGLGGACDPDTQPHVFHNTVTPITATPGFYVVESGDSATHSTGISIRESSTTPKTGDIGDCIDYSYFSSKNSKLDGALASSGLSASYETVVPAEKETVKNILLSYHYQ